MTEEDGPPIIICVRTEGVEPAMGSVEIRGACGHDLWIAPSGLKIVEETGARPMCSACGLESVKEAPEVRLHPPNPEQIAEITLELLNDFARPN